MSYNRLRPIYNIALLTRLIAGIASIFFSYLALQGILNTELNSILASGAISIFLLLLLEIIKNKFGFAFFNEFFLYLECRKKQKKTENTTETVFLGVFFLSFLAISIFLCLEGIKKYSENKTPIISYEKYTTSYDNTINVATNQRNAIFSRVSWKGKINSTSQDAKNMADLDAKILELQAKKVAEYEKYKTTALKNIKYTTNIRQYCGYLLEFTIGFCVFFCFLFLFKTEKESKLQKKAKKKVVDIEQEIKQLNVHLNKELSILYEIVTDKLVELKDQIDVQRSDNDNDTPPDNDNEPPIRSKKVDYVTLDKLIYDKKTAKEIIAETGYSKFTVYNRINQLKVMV